MANTIEATPRSPAQETIPICRREERSGSNIADTASGRPMTVINTIINMAGSSTCGSSTGVTSNPSKKKIIIWEIPVTASKKCTSSRFPGKYRFPIRIPHR